MTYFCWSKVSQMILKLIITFFMTLVVTSYAQPEWSSGEFVSDFVKSEKVKSCLLTPSESFFEFPVIHINSKETLLLQFDDFDNQVRDYVYTITHCNFDWTISDLHENQYLEGFFENYIDDYAFSFNTKTPYVHYELIIPNEDFRFIKSGNYVISVYDSMQPYDVLFSKRFMVYEKSVLIGADVHQTTLAKGRYTDHEVDVVINFTDIDYVNPIQDVKLAIHQGHRWDNVITNLTPTFIEKKRLVYDFEEESSFQAGNEYRFFDTKSVRYNSESVQRIISDSTDVFLLYPDYPLVNKPYSFNQDLEGYYAINIQEKADSRVEADYVWVNFCLKQKPFLSDGNLYVFGGLTDWTLTEDARMVYNLEKACYETSLFLKQGYYNYTYMYHNIENERISQADVEGSFYQASQDYFVFVYMYDYDYGYDRLLNFRKVTTRGMF